MIIKKIAFVMLFINIASYGQHKNNVWLRATVDYQLKNPKIKLDNEFQYRRQDNDLHKFATEKLLISYRNWWYYKATKPLKIAFSPFAYFKYNKPILTEKDVVAPTKTEIRFSAFAELQNKIDDKTSISNRFFTEYRLLTTEHKEVLRYRQRLGLVFNISSKFGFFINDEVFVNVNQPNNFFDQNRLIGQVNVRLSKHNKIETGFMYCTKNQIINQDIIENNFFMNYIFVIN